MTSFNLEVDPKQIEAHENEEAPPYEPTDENNSAAMTFSAKTGANNGNNDSSNKEHECEVVEEDAEEERRANLAIEEANIWSTTGEDQKTGEEIAAEEEIAGPSMEDFFHDTSFDHDLMDKSEEEETTAREEGQSSEKPQAITPAKEKLEELVSLVPKKNNVKPRRPKIRPTSRKKK